MVSDGYRWPADFPPHCPPGTALPADGVFYRIIKSDPPGPGDFVSQYHHNRRLADRNIRQGSATQCETMGLSVFADENDAADRARRYPGIGSRIAGLTLGPASGKILATPRGNNSHHTWWLPDGYDATQIAADVINLHPN